MSALLEYNPLRQITLPGVTLHPKGIVVVVGPNSSGKSLFLRDIEGFLLGGDRAMVVCTDIVPQAPANFDVFTNDLIQRNYLQQQNKTTYRIFVPYMDKPESGERPDSFELQGLRQQYDGLIGDPKGKGKVWFKSIGVTLVAPLSLDTRRSVCEKVKSFNYESAPPKVPLHGLYLNSDAQQALAVETGNIFGNAVWLDVSKPDSLQLRVSGSKEQPTHGQMINPLQASKYRPIEDEGDGYKSYVGIGLSLLLATRPVALIDEPELCLHPPQAYHIGRFIGSYAGAEHVTFVATHSSHVLRGILETGKDVTVIRLTRRGGEFKGHLIENDVLRNAVENPKSRTEITLDGAFSKGVILVESEGDREEYLAACDGIEDYPSREAHIVPVGGTGGFVSPLQLYRTLDIPAAVIADLDAICDTDKTESILKALIADPNACKALVARVRAVAQKVKAITPALTPDEAKARLREMSEQNWNWDNGDDNRVRQEIKKLDSDLRRIRRLKEGGIDAYKDHSDIHSELTACIQECAKVGLFFVPVGELEDWVPHLMKDVPKHSKSKTDRAAIAAEYIRAATDKSNDIWGFIRQVLDFLWTPREIHNIEKSP